jgi:hypothetical protein
MPREITVDMAGYGRGLPPVTLTVRYSRPLRFRLWLAHQALRLTCWLYGAHVALDAEGWSDGK